MNPIIKFLTLALVLVGVSRHPGSQEPVYPSSFTSDRLEQMAAPIALYPDALVAQVLMASTYPLEIVAAYRWLEKNPNLTGSALAEALKQFEWDPSVKSLCGFPTLLKQMSDNLDWTRDLGDAFLGQQEELMDTIQRMRAKALEAGNLKTTEEQRVTRETEVVVIEPVNPEIIYVPSYSALVVYGSGWYYPYWYYPYFYYPPAVGFGYLYFGLGYAWGVGLWGGCDWHHHSVYVHADHYNKFNSHTCHHPKDHKTPHSADGHADWKHDPDHRQGVGYRSSRVAQQYGALPGTSRVTRDQARGFHPSAAPGWAPAGDAGRKVTPPAAGRGAAIQPTTPPAGRGGQRTVPPPAPGTRSVPRPGVPPSTGGVRRTPPSVQPPSGGVQRTPPSVRPPSGGVQRTSPPIRPPSGNVQRTPPSIPPASRGAQGAPARASPPGAGIQRPPRSSFTPPTPRSGSLGGYRNPGFDRSASSRGAASRGGGSPGGASRGGTTRGSGGGK
jgi:hypothetical protein